MTLYRRGSTALGVKANFEPTTGLKVGIDIQLSTENLRVKTDTPIENGIKPNASFSISGLKVASVKLTAGALNGLSDNKGARLEVPIELQQPVIIGGFPFTLSEKFKMIIKPAFSAKNSTLEAVGSWAFTGDLGYDGHSVRLPQVTVKQSMVDSIKGISVGANGFVLAFQARFAVLMGLPVAASGPYGAVTISNGITKGSNLGLTDCRNVQTSVLLAGGVGVNVSAPVKSVLDKILGKSVITKDEHEVTSKEVFNRSTSRPDVPACRLS
ncbi:hypothetical protein F8566_49460 [Actinomadura rudentiformis]|uniref:Uncharacterized protein n=2 Tax=Actinomadura rudentiformis TaxID=359158 RepID=A0A6H9YL01_9ACTN|nr:hypothetical protein F8566_49460 [Actinomadura rudentiformis]